MKKKKHIVITVVIGVLALTYVLYPYFLKMKDKAIVKEYNVLNTAYADISPSDNKKDFAIVLVDGINIKCNDFKFYSKSMSHHNWFIFFDGYRFINLNGEIFSKNNGSCEGIELIRFPKVPLNQINKDMFVAELKRRGYKKEK